MNQWLSGVFQEFFWNKLEETVYCVIFFTKVAIHSGKNGPGTIMKKTF